MGGISPQARHRGPHRQGGPGRPGRAALEQRARRRPGQGRRRGRGEPGSTAYARLQAALRKRGCRTTSRRRTTTAAWSSAWSRATSSSPPTCPTSASAAAGSSTPSPRCCATSPTRCRSTGTPTRRPDRPGTTPPTGTSRRRGRSPCLRRLNEQQRIPGERLTLAAHGPTAARRPSRPVAGDQQRRRHRAVLRRPASTQALLDDIAAERAASGSGGGQARPRRQPSTAHPTAPPPDQHGRNALMSVATMPAGTETGAAPEQKKSEGWSSSAWCWCWRSRGGGVLVRPQAEGPRTLAPDPAVVSMEPIQVNLAEGHYLQMALALAAHHDRRPRGRRQQALGPCHRDLQRTERQHPRRPREAGPARRLALRRSDCPATDGQRTSRQFVAPQ